MASVLLLVLGNQGVALATPARAILRQVAWEQGHLVVLADRPVVFEHHLLHDPERMIVDVLGADEPTAGLPAEIPIGVGALRDVRIARHPHAGFVRIVIDLKGPGDQVSWRLDDRVPVPPPILAHAAGRRVAWKVRLVARRARQATRPARHALRPSRITWSGGEQDGADVNASPSVWPAQTQTLDRLRIERRGRETILELHAKRPLMAWVEQGLLPPSLTVRVPRSTYLGPVPSPAGLIRHLAMIPENREWDVSAALPAGIYVCRRSEFDGGRGLSIAIRRRKKLVPGRPIVVIDPGHGGYDPGTAGPAGDLEKDVALQVARKVAVALGKEGYQVVLTRTMDAFIRLSDRRAFMESIGAVAFVSLHCNSSTTAGVDGIETYYRGAAGEPLARALQHRLVAATRDVDRGIRKAHLYVLKEGVLPASLVELGFLTNPKEELRLRSPVYQETLAWAVARGIQDFLDGRAVASRTR